jgi:molybdopterin molybdotransferase
MLSVRNAEAIVLDCVQPLTTVETIPLARVRDRILAETLISPLEFPHWDNSAMDGYAVRYSEARNCPISLPISMEISAGMMPSVPLQPGTAARIFTGAMLPEGADTVVMQENTERNEDTVTIYSPPAASGAFVRTRGSFLAVNRPFLKAGTILQAPEMAAIAAMGIAEVSVYRRCRVAIISTGDELLPLGEPLPGGKIYDSNQYALLGFVRQMAAKPIVYGIVPDDRQQLQETMQAAISNADIVLSTGGVSVGSRDYVEEILGDLGGDIKIRAVAIKPGKPVTVATFSRSNSNLQSESVIYFGLPGNPVSALVTAWRFVRPAIAKLSGRDEMNWCLPWIDAVTQHNLKSDGKRETYLWGKTVINNGNYEFAPLSHGHNSGDAIGLIGANALAVVPIGQTSIAAGTKVRLLLIRSSV